MIIWFIILNRIWSILFHNKIISTKINLWITTINSINNKQMFRVEFQTLTMVLLRTIIIKITIMMCQYMIIERKFLYKELLLKMMITIHTWKQVKPILLMISQIKTPLLIVNHSILINSIIVIKIRYIPLLKITMTLIPTLQTNPIIWAMLNLKLIITMLNLNKLMYNLHHKPHMSNLHLNTLMFNLHHSTLMFNLHLKQLMFIPRLKLLMFKHNLKPLMFNPFHKLLTLVVSLTYLTPLKEELAIFNPLLFTNLKEILL